MFRSLRFRITALFLAGIVLAGLVATVIAIELFQDYAHDQKVAELRREARGLAALYAQQALARMDNRNEPSPTPPSKLEAVTGDYVYYVGGDIFLGLNKGLTRLPDKTVNWRAGRVITFELVPPGRDRTFLAVAHPLRLERGGQSFGALVVATPKAALRSRWVTLVERLALAFIGGLLVAGALGWYVSRRVTGPLLALSRAADEVAEGHYAVAVPRVAGGDEVAHLSERFRQMATRLAEVDELERNFLMSVSHELRTPLTAIRGHVDALREGVLQDPAAQAESLNVIAAETDRLARLVNDVLDLAKLDTRRFTLLHEEVDMGRLCEQAYTAFGEEARRRGIDYHQEMRARPVIVSDGDRVLQIISNLLSNAFRWTPNGGRIELTLGTANGTVHVDVEDSGPGIEPDERDRIFRPFFSQDGSGTGLGLTIARELANALGGRIDVESEPGEGSRFQLVLPAEPA
jgi:signal transduction histidine kinase